MAFIKAFAVNMAITAIWYAIEYLQYKELQWGRYCDDVVSLLYFIVLLYLFKRLTRRTN